MSENGEEVNELLEINLHHKVLITNGHKIGLKQGNEK